jgi:hypothetical protein
MGQYYVPITQSLFSGDILAWDINPKDYRDEQGHFDFDKYDYTGIKLMEHSYFGTNITNAISKFLYKNPSRLWWVGDYVGKEEAEEHEIPVVSNVNYGYKSDDATEDFIGFYILNHSKKVGFKLEKSIDNEWNIYPIALLTAVGNGRGGGDYFSGSNMELVGSWAGDILSVDEKIPTNYKEIKPLIFREG